MKEIIKGTKEQRINRMMRMTLEWQSDINDKKSELKNSSYYFKKYHIGPYKVDLFSDIATANINREWVINKMNICSQHKKMLKANLENKRQNKIDFKCPQPSLFDDDIDSIIHLRPVRMEKNISDFTDMELINELKKRDYKIIKEY